MVVMSYQGSLKECSIVSLLNHFALFSRQSAFLMCLQSLNMCVVFFTPRQLVLDYESKEKNPLSCCWNSRMTTGLTLSSLRWRVLSNKVRLHCLSAVYSSRMINYLITHLRFIQWGWITPLADFLCILTSHTHTHWWRDSLGSFWNQIHF